MATKPTRIKADTYEIRYQSREQVESAIKEIGDLQRELERQATLQNDELAAINEKYSPIFNDLKEQIKPIQAAVQAWCESHRDELTQNGKTKTGSFNTGEVQWRQKPPSVLIRGAEAVLEALESLGLNRFIRTKAEINKEAILAEPDKVSAVKGIRIKSGVEDFVIKPFEQDVK